MRFLLDENVTSSVATFLRERGHEVFLVREQLTPDVEDPIIVAHAHQIQAIIITWNRKHFKPLISRQTSPITAEFTDAGLIALKCRFDLAVPLLEQFIDNIEFEYQKRQRMADTRVIVELGHNGLMTY